jgi:hypothetical protein
MPTFDESGHWLWDEESGQWVPAAAAVTSQAPAPQPPVDRPAAPDSGYSPPTAPGATTPPTEAPKKRRGGLIAIIVVLGLCAVIGLCGVVGTAIWSLNSAKSSAQDAAAKAAARQAEIEKQLKAATIYATPNEVVDAWYAAVSAGDLAKLKSIATSGFAEQIGAPMFEGRDPATEYRIVSSSVGDTGQVTVQESSGTAPTTVTFDIVKTDNGYLIAGLRTTAATDSGTGATGPDATPKQATVITKTEAVDVVGRILDARKNSRIAEAKSLATPDFQKDQADVFFTSSGDAFTNFQVTGAIQRGDVWYVKAKEDWISGTEYATYAVVTVNGKGLVDGWETASQ